MSAPCAFDPTDPAHVVTRIRGIADSSTSSESSRGKTTTWRRVLGALLLFSSSSMTAADSALIVKTERDQQIAPERLQVRAYLDGRALRVTFRCRGAQPDGAHERIECFRLLRQLTARCTCSKSCTYLMSGFRWRLGELTTVCGLGLVIAASCSSEDGTPYLFEGATTQAGGVVLLLVDDLQVSSTGAISASPPNVPRTVAFAGGYVHIIGSTLALGDKRVTALGSKGLQPLGPFAGQSNRASPGYIVLSALSVSGTTDPPATQLALAVATQ